MNIFVKMVAVIVAATLILASTFTAYAGELPAGSEEIVFSAEEEIISGEEIKPFH